jgi:hypothetical protein
VSSRKKPAVIRSRKAQPDPYTSRIMKAPSKRELEARLNHAVRNHDFDALEDYDENQLHPPTGVIAPLPDDPDGLRELGDDIDIFDRADEQRASQTRRWSDDDDWWRDDDF